MKDNPDLLSKLDFYLNLINVFQNFESEMNASNVLEIPEILAQQLVSDMMFAPSDKERFKVALSSYRLIDIIPFTFKYIFPSEEFLRYRYPQNAKSSLIKLYIFRIHVLLKKILSVFIQRK